MDGTVDGFQIFFFRFRKNKLLITFCFAVRVGPQKYSHLFTSNSHLTKFTIGDILELFCKLDIRNKTAPLTPNQTI